MKLGVPTIAVVVIAWLVGCGPSAQVKEARKARYGGQPEVLLRETAEAVKAHYPLEGVDPDGMLVVTESRWYTKEGGSTHRASVRRLNRRGVVNERVIR